MKFKRLLYRNLLTYSYLSDLIKKVTGDEHVYAAGKIEDRNNVKLDALAMTRLGNPIGYDEALKDLESQVLIINDLLDKYESKLLLVTIPYGHMVDGKQWSKGRAAWGFEKGKVYSDKSLQDLTKFAKENKIQAIDLTPVMKLAAADETLYFNYDGHLTKNGHRVVAEAILAGLQNLIK